MAGRVMTVFPEIAVRSEDIRVPGNDGVCNQADGMGGFAKRRFRLRVSTAN
jgi:hypothetical protein